MNNPTMRRLEVTAGFLVMNAVSYLLSPLPLLPIFLAAAVLHECGHIAAIILLGGRVDKLRLSAFGAELQSDLRRLSYPKEVVVYLSGPLTGLAAALLSAYAARLLNSELLYIFSGCNAALSVFNLLPAKPLDGGGVARALTLLRCGRETALITVLHFVSIALLMAVGVYVTLHGGFNLALFWTAGWLLLSGDGHG